MRTRTTSSMPSGRRRRLLAAALGLFVPAVAAQREPAATKRRRIGVLDVFPRGDPRSQFEEFIAAMARLGFRENREVQYLHRYLHRFPAGEEEKAFAGVPALAAELVRQAPDVLVAEGTPLTVALSRATKTIPIVTNVGDPIGAGFAQSLARPGGNVTGVALGVRETAVKSFELLKRIVPGSWSVAIVDGDLSAPSRLQGTIEDGARANGLVLRNVRLDKGVDPLPELAAMRAKGIRVVSLFTWIPGITDDDEALSGELLRRYGLITAPDNEHSVAKGGLLAYESSGDDTLDLKANQVVKILRGARAGEIPFEVSTRYRFTINLGAARKLGLAIPQDVIVRADKVYE